MNLAARDPLDVEHEQAVVEQQRVTRLHLPRQILVVEADSILGAKRSAGVENKLLSGAQRRFAALEFSDADLRPLQIGHDRNVAAELGSGLTYQLRAREMIFRRSVREIEAHDVDAGDQHALEHQRFTRRWSERGNYLRAAWH